MRNSSIKKLGALAGKLQKISDEFSTLQKELWDKEREVIGEGLTLGYAISQAASKAKNSYEFHNEIN